MKTTTKAHPRQPNYKMVPVVRTELVRESTAYFESPKISGATDAYNVLFPYMQNSPVELGYALYLNTKNRVIGIAEIARGTVDSCGITAQQIYPAAFLLNATSIILAHNHPSGDPEPSSADISLTHRLSASADLLGINLLDHIVIGVDRYVSLRERSLMHSTRPVLGAI